MSQIVGIYFPEGVDANAARAKFSRVAKRHGFGPGELITAIGEGKVNIYLSGETITQTDLAQLPFTALLNTAADQINNPQLAAELKRRIRVLNEAGL